MIDRNASLGALESVHVRQALFKGIRNGLICASLVGLFCLLFFGEHSGLLSGLMNGLSFGLLTGLIIGTLSGITTGMREEKSAKTKCLEGIWPGLCALIGFSCVQGMLHIIDGLTSGCVVAVFFSAVYSFGKANEPLSIQPAEMVAWSGLRVRKNLLRGVRRGTLIGLITFFGVAICFGVISGIARGPGYGIALGLVFGPIIGMSVGTAVILSAVLNSGRTNNLLQKEEIIHPSGGIRRSARNVLLSAALFGPVGGITCGMVCGISFGLIGRLASWPVLATGFALTFSILFSFYFLMAHGMMACLEQVCLRSYLWYKGSVPLNYARFLNYAVEHILLRKIGGGYVFVHPLLFDYFAEDVSLDEERKHHDSSSR